MKRNRTGLILAICICVVALICGPILTSVFDLGAAGYTAAVVTLCVAGPMLLIALFLCLFGQWKNRPYYWLPEDLAKQKMKEDAQCAAKRAHVHKKEAAHTFRSFKKPLLAVALFGFAIFTIVLLIVGAAGLLGESGSSIAFTVFMFIGPVVLISLCLSLFGQWKKKPYYWLPEELAKQKMAEDAAREHRA